MYLNPHSGDIPFMTSLWMGTRGVIYSIWGAVCARLSLLCSVCVTLCSWLWKAGGNRHTVSHTQKRLIKLIVNPSQCCIALPVSHLYCHWLILPPPHPPGLAPLLLVQYTLKDLCMWVAHICEHGWWWITLARHCCLLFCHYLTSVFISSVYSWATVHHLQMTRI